MDTGQATDMPAALAECVRLATAIENAGGAIPAPLAHLLDAVELLLRPAPPGTLYDPSSIRH